MSGSQAQISKVLEVMNCEDEYESSVRRLPNIDVRRRVQHENDLGAATMQRIDIVFRKGIKAWARMLLPHMKAIDGISYKNVFSITSLLAPMEETTQDEEGSEVHLSSASIPTQVLDTIPVTIRDMLKCKKPLMQGHFLSLWLMCPRLTLHHCSPSATNTQGLYISKPRWTSYI